MSHDSAIKLVALDIDGTLLDKGVDVDAMPDPDMVDAVRSLQASGIVVVLASGRMYPGTASVAHHLGIDEPLICQQGASVHEPDGSLRHGHAINQGVAHELLGYARLHGWPLAWFDPVRYLVTEDCSEARFFADVSGVAMEIDPNPHLSGVQATGIDIISTREEASQVHAEIERRYATRLCLLDFPSVTAVHAIAVSKGNALRELAGELGVAQDQVLAVGDSVNDVSMLRWAGHSAAPAHCDAHAATAAKEILAGDGVSGVVEKLAKVAAGG